MKKLLLALLALSLICSVALAEVDLSGMTFEELVALKDQINLAIWNSDEWQEVTVPMGVWLVGEDIPAGHWTIKVAPTSGSSWASVAIGTALDETGKDIDIMDSDFYWGDQVALEGADTIVEKTELDFDMKDGQYVIIDYADVVFSPYAGKPSLGFK